MQLIQNVATCLVCTSHKYCWITPLLCSLHCFPVAAQIQFKTLMLVYKAKNGPVPKYLQGLVKPCIVSHNLRPSSLFRLGQGSPSAHPRTWGKQASKLYLLPNDGTSFNCLSELLIVFRSFKNRLFYFTY